MMKMGKKSIACGLWLHAAFKWMYQGQHPFRPDASEAEGPDFNVYNNIEWIWTGSTREVNRNLSG